MSGLPQQGLTFESRLDSLRALLPRLRCEPVQPGLPAWELSRARWTRTGPPPTASLWRRLLNGLSGSETAAATAAAKKELLRQMLDQWDGWLLNFDEDPLQDRLAGAWASVSPSCWRVPATVDVPELYRWLEPGNWTLYRRRDGQPGASPWSIPDVRRPSLVLESMAAQDVVLVLDSFYDNDPWHLFLNPRYASAPRPPAAS